MERTEDTFTNHTPGSTSPSGQSATPNAATGGATGTGTTGGGARAALADRLEAGADIIRQRAGSGQLAGAGADIGVGSDRVMQVAGSAANALQSGADLIRDADLDSLKRGVEKQVREHPARSLLIALGVGYLIGKALRR